jgi:putative ABC transport system permease protein
VLLSVGYLVVIISALSIMIGLYLAITQRRRDLAIMRALGASRIEIFGSVLIEAFWVTVLGILAGYLLGGVITRIVGYYLTQKYGLSVTPFIMTSEHITSFATVAIVGLLAGIIPAWQAYRRNIARDLAEL